MKYLCPLIIFVALLAFSCSLEPLRLTSATGKVTIKFSTWGSPEEMTINRRIVAGFMKSHPGINVEIMHIPGAQYNTKLQILNAAGVAPDVMWLTSWQSVALYENKRLRNLSSFIQQERKTTPDFLREDDSLINYCKDSFTYKGETLICPLGPVTFHLYYNKDLFDEAGLPYPGADWTWDTFRDAAIQLTKNENEHPVQFGTSLSPWWGFWLNFVWQNEGELFDRMVLPTRCILDSPASLQALTFLQDMIYKYHASPSPVQAGALGGDFMTGKIAMEIEGSWMIEQFRSIRKFRWGMAPVPRGKTFSVAVRICGHGIKSDSKHPDEAWELVKYYQSPEAQSMLGDFALWIPSREYLARDPSFWHPQGVPDNHADCRISDIKKARSGDVLHVEAVKICETILPTELDLFWLGQKSATECMETIIPKVNAILQNDGMN
jgi:multiple sugar transport system substrate-binding protein